MHSIHIKLRSMYPWLLKYTKLNMIFLHAFIGDGLQMKHVFFVSL